MVSLTFVFGNNMRSIYEAVVYLFVVHPYDVGDAVLVGPSQDWCTVSYPNIHGLNIGCNNLQLIRQIYLEDLHQLHV